MGRVARQLGVDELKPLQRDFIRTARDGRSALLTAPTSFGKSVCFQVPVLLSEGLGLVMCPLVALARNQVDDLNLEDLNEYEKKVADW